MLNESKTMGSHPFLCKYYCDDCCRLSIYTYHASPSGAVGIWPLFLMGSLVGYLSVLDMGLGNTIVRYTAKNRADGTAETESKLNGLFLFIYSIIGIVALGVGLVLYANIENLFGATLSIGEMQRARIMMLLLIFNVAVSFPLSIFSSIMQAYERFIFCELPIFFECYSTLCWYCPFYIGDMVLS